MRVSLGNNDTVRKATERGMLTSDLSSRAGHVKEGEGRNADEK